MLQHKVVNQNDNYRRPMAYRQVYAHLQETEVEHPAFCLWLTGLSGAGKTTLANRMVEHLRAEGRPVFCLDGDVLRTGLCRDLGFSPEDRSENIRRAAEVAKLFVDAGFVVVAAFISPFVADRAMARSVLGPERFYEVFVDAPIQTCEQRDVKGLYARAAKGEIPNFTGLTSPYEPPVAPDLHLKTSLCDVDQSFATLWHFCQQRVPGQA